MVAHFAVDVTERERMWGLTSCIEKERERKRGLEIYVKRERGGDKKRKRLGKVIARSKLSQKENAAPDILYKGCCCCFCCKKGKSNTCSNLGTFPEHAFRNPAELKQNLSDNQI